MITRYQAWLDGQGLHDIDPTIIITDIQELVPEDNIATAGIGVRSGLRVLRKQRDSLSVSIRFMIREYSTARRKAIYDEIVTWAHDGILTINDRPDQRLHVVCEILPTVPSALQWTNNLTITFTAFTLPFWEAVYPTTATVTGSSGTATLYIMGNEPCNLEADVQNTSGGTINTLTISANGTAFSFAGLGLDSGQTLSILYEDGILAARIGTRGVLTTRTETSSDDIILKPCTSNAVTVQAGGSVKAIIRARGLWR